MTTLLRQKARALLDAPLAQSQVARTLYSAAFLLLAVAAGWVSYGGYKNASHKTTKEQAIEAVDRTTKLGRIILDERGIVVSWNAGCTDLLGWTSEEMRGSDLSRITPDDNEQGADIVQVIGTPHTKEIIASASTMLKTKGGDHVQVDLLVEDLEGMRTVRLYRHGSILFLRTTERADFSG